jgi:hypothetical protein
MPVPFSPVYLNQQVARVAAALAGAGAYDAAPLELYCNTFEKVTLFFTYTRGGAAGAFAFRVDVSPDGVGATWFRQTLYASVAVATGADSQSDVQREAVEYGATGANAEAFVFGPIELGGAVERIRIAAAETGNVAAPGNLAIRAVFGE